MAERRVELAPEAAAEIRAVYVWYRERNAIAADGFLRDLERLFSMLAFQPELGVPLGGTAGTRVVRQVPLRRYPFVILHTAVPEGVRVLAVAHSRRRPGYWSSGGEEG